jgi:hypothetical protein
VDALLAKGEREAAAAALRTLRTDFPKDPEVQKRVPSAP